MYRKIAETDPVEKTDSISPAAGTVTVRPAMSVICRSAASCGASVGAAASGASVALCIAVPSGGGSCAGPSVRQPAIRPAASASESSSASNRLVCFINVLLSPVGRLRPAPPDGRTD